MVLLSLISFGRIALILLSVYCSVEDFFRLFSQLLVGRGLQHCTRLYCSVQSGASKEQPTKVVAQSTLEREV